MESDRGPPAGLVNRAQVRARARERSRESCFPPLAPLAPLSPLLSERQLKRSTTGKCADGILRSSECTYILEAKSAYKLPKLSLRSSYQRAGITTEVRDAINQIANTAADNCRPDENVIGIIALRNELPSANSDDFWNDILKIEWESIVSQTGRNFLLKPMIVPISTLERLSCAMYSGQINHQDLVHNWHSNSYALSGEWEARISQLTSNDLSMPKDMFDKLTAWVEDARSY